MQMALDSLPLELWELIWRCLTLRHKARLDLCSSTLRRDLWQRSPVMQLVPGLATPEEAIQLFSVRPAAGRELRRFYFPAPQVLPSHLLLHAAFASTTALTHICVKESTCLVFNALVTARCPLKNVTIVSLSGMFYWDLDLRGFEVFKGTLRRLSLLISAPLVPPPPPTFFPALITHLGPTLETLSLNLADWSPLKPMTALKELFILDRNFKSEYFNMTDLPSTAARVLARTPPGVGLNLVFLSLGTPSSILTQAMNAGAEKVKELIDSYPVDVNLAPYSNFFVTSRCPVLFSAISSSQYDVAKVLIQKGASLVAPQAAPATFRSAFLTLLMQWGPLDPKWISFANYLFDECWPTAIGQWTRTDLLGPHPGELFTQLLRTSPSATLPTKAQFVLDRPAIFGPRSLTDLNTDGCNLCHIGRDKSTAKMLEQLGVDWRVKDKAGLDALECIARARSRTGPNGLIEHWCQRDEDFVAHCTPLVWGMVYCGPSWGAADDDFDALVQRMLRLCPREQCEEVTNAIQAQLRDSYSADSLRGWLRAGGPALSASVVRALFRPWSEVRQWQWFRSLQFGEFLAQPLPHCTWTKEQLQRIGRLAKAHFSSQAAAMEWIHERNDLGQTTVESITARYSREEAQERIENLKFLWPCDSA